MYPRPNALRTCVDRPESEFWNCSDELASTDKDYIFTLASLSLLFIFLFILTRQQTCRKPLLVIKKKKGIETVCLLMECVKVVVFIWNLQVGKQIRKERN
jgi:hypothetical protein